MIYSHFIIHTHSNLTIHEYTHILFQSQIYSSVCQLLISFNCNFLRYFFLILLFSFLLSLFSSCADKVNNVLLLSLLTFSLAQCNKCVSYSIASPAFNVPVTCFVSLDEEEFKERIKKR